MLMFSNYVLLRLIIQLILSDKQELLSFAFHCKELQKNVHLKNCIYFSRMIYVTFPGYVMCVRGKIAPLKLKQLWVMNPGDCAHEINIQDWVISFLLIITCLLTILSFY